MQSCTIDRIMFSQLLDILVAKVKDNIWALFICISGLDIDSGGLKLIKSDADVHALYDLVEKHVKVDMFVVHLPQNLAVYYNKNICLDGSDEEVTSKKGNMIKERNMLVTIKELIAWTGEEAKSPYLRSPPLKSRPFRNDMKGKVLFTDMYCAEDEEFEMTPPLNDDEAGTEDLLINISNLENDNQNDAAKILDGMSASKNDASKYVEYIESIIDRKNEGRNEGRNDGMNQGTSAQGQDTTVDVDRFGEVDDTYVGLTPLIREHEKSMEALLRKLKGNKMGITDPFTILEDSKEKYPIYDDLTYWKLKKPNLGKKFPTIDKFKECLTYYALANGFLLIK
ncbi:hypothetical protein Tco_1542787, partial [Tanacetum coccineum]